MSKCSRQKFPLYIFTKFGYLTFLSALLNGATLVVVSIQLAVEVPTPVEACQTPAAAPLGYERREVIKGVAALRVGHRLHGFSRGVVSRDISSADIVSSDAALGLVDLASRGVIVGRGLQPARFLLGT